MIHSLRSRRLGGGGGGGGNWTMYCDCVCMHVYKTLDSEYVQYSMVKQIRINKVLYTFKLLISEIFNGKQP